MKLTHSHATNRNTKCYWVSFGWVHVLFSYDTPVFAQFNNEFRKRGYISKTTSRHIKESISSLALSSALQVDAEQMDAFIAEALVGEVSRTVTQRIEGMTQ